MDEQTIILEWNKAAAIINPMFSELTADQRRMVHEFGEAIYKYGFEAGVLSLKKE